MRHRALLICTRSMTCLTLHGRGFATTAILNLSTCLLCTLPVAAFIITIVFNNFFGSFIDVLITANSTVHFLQLCLLLLQGCVLCVCDHLHLLNDIKYFLRGYL